MLMAALPMDVNVGPAAAAAAVGRTVADVELVPRGSLLGGSLRR
jgi:hypothetical protein